MRKKWFSFQIFKVFFKSYVKGFFLNDKLSLIISMYKITSFAEKQFVSILFLVKSAVVCKITNALFDQHAMKVSFF